jgi:GNAT superfamily N-acetyltransferase
MKPSSTARGPQLKAHRYNTPVPLTRHERLDDIPALVRLVNRAFLAEGPYIEGERIDDPTLREMLAKGSFLLFEEAGEIIACTYIEPRGDRAHLGLVSVDPARQGKGLGSQLMAAVEAHCRQAGFREMELRFINHRTEVERFYTRLGFLPTGVTESVTNHRVKVPFHFVQMVKKLA